MTDIADVIARMRALEDELPRRDGVRYFNRLYLTVTERVAELLPGDTFEDPPFIEQLDVTFAEAYFTALTAPSPAWKPLMERRTSLRVAPIQFALAGVNAHVNYDLPVGVVSTCEAMNLVVADGSPQQRDYDRLNTVLGGVEEEVKSWLLTGWLRRFDRWFGHVDDVVANWSLARARDAAWVHAKALWRLRDEPEVSLAYRDTLCHEVGFAGRGLLLPSIPGLQRVADLVRRP